MSFLKNILRISLIFLIIGISSLESRGQFLWLGFQAGEGVSWFSNPDNVNTQLSEGAGTSLGLFIRYGTRPYYQLAFEWLFSTNQMKFEVPQGSTVHDNIPFHNFKVPVTVGYEIIHRPKFKWRAGGGMFIGTTTILNSNAFNFTASDIRNPQWGIIGETGIQFLNFLLSVDYNYSLSRFFADNSNTYNVDVHSHLQIFALKVGMQF